MMPDPKTYKQHFENKHPKNPIPADLQQALASARPRIRRLEDNKEHPRFISFC